MERYTPFQHDFAIEWLARLLATRRVTLSHPRNRFRAGQGSAASRILRLPRQSLPRDRSLAFDLNRTYRWNEPTM